MPTSPQPITLRPLSAADLADASISIDAPDMDVYVRVTHAGQSYYAPGRVKTVRPQAVYTGGLFEYQLARARKDVERVVIGQHIEIVATDEMGHEFTDYVDTSPEVFDALYPEKYPEANERGARATMLKRRSERTIAVPSDGGPGTFEGRTAPIYGAEVNLRLVIEDADPETVVAELTALLAGKGRVARAQARPVPDFRVNVTETVMNEDFKPTAIVRAVNVLEADVIEFMRTAGQGTISTSAIPYGAPAPVVAS